MLQQVAIVTKTGVAYGTKVLLDLEVFDLHMRFDTRVTIEFPVTKLTLNYFSFFHRQAMSFQMLDECIFVDKSSKSKA